MNNRLKKLLDNPWILINYLAGKGVFNFLCDRLYLKLMFKARTGQTLDLQNPESFNEKLQWLKLYDRNPEYTKMVDKYEVRKYIAEKIGEEYLIPLIGVWNDFIEIDFNKLPNQFVLKCTHDSGGLVICKDKSKIDIKATKHKISEYLKRNYYCLHREWPYKNVEPRLICEKFMVDESGNELKDYKIFCFSGKPKIIQVDYNRFSGHKRNMYDSDWNYIPASVKYPTDPNTIINKPDRLKDMLALAEILAKDYPHVRIDFYSIKDKIYFGEMTFYHEAGFGEYNPKDFGMELGRWINLPIKKVR